MEMELAFLQDCFGCVIVLSNALYLEIKGDKVISEKNYEDAVTEKPGALLNWPLLICGLTSTS